MNSLENIIYLFIVIHFLFESSMRKLIPHSVDSYSQQLVSLANVMSGDDG